MVIRAMSALRDGLGLRGCRSLVGRAIGGAVAVPMTTRELLPPLSRRAIWLALESVENQMGTEKFNPELGKPHWNVL